MAYYNLPKFGRDAPFPPAPDAGLWARADGTLGQLGKSLKVDAQPFSDPDEPVRAIPDPWAQPRSFAEALLEPGHSMHDSAVGQWRGMLAVFALSALHSADYSLTPRRVGLGTSHLFDRVLVHLTPQLAIGDRVALWEDPWLIMAETHAGKPRAIGMTNPACLISPGRDSRTIALPGIPWVQAGFADPLSLPDASALSVPQIAVLACWLRNLQAELMSVSGEISSRIRALLSDYAEDCEASIGPVALEVAMEPGLYGDLPDIFRPLWATAKPLPILDPAALSRTRVRLNPKFDLGPLKGIILVDSDLGNHPQYDPRRTFVWGARTLAELINSDAVFQRTREDAAREGYWLVRPADFFTERAVRFDHQPVISGHPQGLQDMLLPVRPVALLLDLPLKQIVGSQSTASQVSATLSLRLDDGSEGGFRHVMTRNYAVDAPQGRPLFVNNADWRIYNASVWPDFQSSAWSTYLARFTYSAASRSGMARPAQLLSAALMASEIAGAEDALAATTRLSDLNSGKRPEIRQDRFLRSERDAGGEYEDVQYSATPIDALYYLEAFGERAEAAGGMVFLDLPEIEPKPIEHVVAVDFGTTNTVACFDDLKPILFKARLVTPIKFKDMNKTRDMSHAARWLLSKFLPPEDRLNPTPTVALTRTPYPSQETLWVFRNLVYFHSTLRHAANGEAKELQQFARTAADAKFNLKWSEDPAHAEAATDFLEQFMMMIAAEAVAMRRDPRHLLWNFSVPDSLGGRRREEFEGQLRKITKRISSAVDENKTRILAPLYSEGLAAARYILAGAGFNAQSLNVVLDIGGGTTDVTIWDVDRLVWKGSFRIAGQNFFTRAISQNPEVLRPIGLEHWISLFAPPNEAERTVAPEDIPHLAEMLFSGPALQSAIDAHWETKLNIGPGKTLRITALVFLAGLAWYVGLVVRRLVDDGTIDPEQLERPAFALCGRGAGIFKKMHGGRPADAPSDVTRALQVFGRAAGIDTRPMPQLFTTSDAKLEVVRGMLTDTGLIDASVGTGLTGASEYLPAGLGLQFRSGEPLETSGLIGDFKFTERVKSVDLAQLTAFLGELKETDDVALDLFDARGQGAFGLIQNGVRTEIDQASRANPDQLVQEPPFIIALRQLVDQLALPEEVRAKHLTMDFK